MRCWDTDCHKCQYQNTCPDAIVYEDWYYEEIEKEPNIIIYEPSREEVHKDD